MTWDTVPSLHQANINDEIWQFLESSQLVIHVFIAVAVVVYHMTITVCDGHGIGP